MLLVIQSRRRLPTFRVSSMPARHVLFALAAAMTLSTSDRSGVFAQQDDKVIVQLQTRTNGFFRLVKEGVELERAFEELLADGPLALTDGDPKKRNDVRKLVERMRTLESSYGALLEAESVQSKMVGRDLVLLKYLYKTERFPVVWYFTYYRPPVIGRDDDQWFVISVRFDARFESLAF